MSKNRKGIIRLSKNPLNRGLLLDGDELFSNTRVDNSLFDDPAYLNYLIERYGGYGCGDLSPTEDDDDYFDYRCRNKDVRNNGYDKTMRILNRYSDINGASSSKKSNKRGGKRLSGKHKGKYSNVNKYDDNYQLSLYNGDDYLYNKIIYFYPDDDNPDNYERFTNVFAFDKYLEENGIDISDYEVQNILGRDVSHCVINAYKRLYQGKLEILSGNSYSDLRYSNAGCGSID